MLGRDPVFEADDHAAFFRVARHFFHHGDKGVDLPLIGHVDVAIAENGKQDVVGADVARHFHGLDQQDGRSRVGVQRQPRLPGEPIASEQIWMPFSSAARRKAACVCGSRNVGVFPSVGNCRLTWMPSRPISRASAIC